MDKDYIIFYETKHFIREVKKVFKNDEVLRLKQYLEQYPLSGDVISGAGGIRKLRWAKVGSGKRKGFRVIYYFYVEEGIIFCFLSMLKILKLI